MGNHTSSSALVAAQTIDLAELPKPNLPMTIAISTAAERDIRALSPGVLRALDERYRRHKGHGHIPQFPIDLFSPFRLTEERISTFRCRNGKRSNRTIDYDAFITECRESATPHKNRDTVEKEVGHANFLAEAALGHYTPDERKDIAGALWFTSRGITINGITLTLVKPAYTEDRFRIRGEIKRPGADIMFQNSSILLFNALPQSAIDGMNTNALLPGKIIDLPWSGKERILRARTLEGTTGNYTDIVMAKHDPWTGAVEEQDAG